MNITHVDLECPYCFEDITPPSNPSDTQVGQKECPACKKLFWWSVRVGIEWTNYTYDEYKEEFGE